MTNQLKYFLLVIAGLVLIFICNIFYGPRIAASFKPGDEYYFSSFFSRNYSLLTVILFFIAGSATGYYWKLNPWYSGIFLIAIFPLTSMGEALIYKGSHNLIRFEFVFHFCFALPAIAGVYLGRLILSERLKR